MNDPIYQIFRLGIHWSQPISADDKTEYSGNWTVGLPAGRRWSSYDFYHMPKGNITLEDAEIEAQRKGKPALDRALAEGKIVDAQDIHCTAVYLRSESWCMGWFTHWTHRAGMTGQEAICSFERFVRRMEDLNRREGRRVDGLWHEPYCLMGAEDRYRWSGERDAERNPTTPPCDCEHCVKADIYRIDH